MAKWIRVGVGLLAILCLHQQQGFSQPSTVQAKGTDQNVGADSTLTLNVPVTTGNHLIGFVWWLNPTGTLTCVTGSTDTCGSISTDTYTLLDNPTTINSGVSDFARAAMFCVASSVGGYSTIAAHFSANPTTAHFIVHEVSGTDNTSCVDQHHINTQWFTGSGTDAITSTTVTPTANGEYVFGATSDTFASHGITPGTGFTLGVDVASGGVSVSESKIQSMAGAIAATFSTPNNEGWLTGVATLKAIPVASAAGRVIGRRIIH